MNHFIELADRFFRAIETGDLETVRSIYAPDARIWHNTDQNMQSVEENLKILIWFVKFIPQRHYRVVARWETPNGFGQQHVLELATANGRFAMPACIIAKVSDGRVIQLDEYLDSAHVAEMRLALGI